MAFKDVMQFLFERLKAKNGGRLTHEEYADHLGIPRASLTQILSGNIVPAAKTMWRIIEKEGYDLDHCIELPDMRDERESRLAAVEMILGRNDETARMLRLFVDLIVEKENLTTMDRPPPKVASKKRRVS